MLKGHVSPGALRHRFSSVLAAIAAAFLLIAGAASAAGDQAAPWSVAASSSEDPFSLAAGNWLMPGDPRLLAELRRVNPEAVSARAVSATAYSGLSASAAAALAQATFPELVNQAEGGVPPLPSGDKLLRLTGSNTAAVLTGKGHAVLQSTLPIATRTSTGTWAPLNLSLRASQSGFQPVAGAVSVHLSRDLQEGVGLPAVGVSLAPLAQNGFRLATASSGRIAGASVIWPGASAGPDVDELARATSGGVEFFSILRSQSSPTSLRFRISVPAGAEATQAAGHGPIQIVTAFGQHLAIIPPPTAVDAEGTSVPVAMHLNGTELVLHVPHRSVSYRYPISVDPAVWDDQLHENANWKYGATSTNITAAVGQIEADFYHAAGEWGMNAYETQGETRVTAFQARLEDTSAPGEPENYESLVYIASKSGVYEGTPSQIVGAWGPEWVTNCGNGNCEGSGGSAGNFAAWQMLARETGSEHFDGHLIAANILIADATTPTAKVDTIDRPTVEGKPNAGTGEWVDPGEGGASLVIEAADSGLGIDKATLTSPDELPENPYAHETPMIWECTGVQCTQCLALSSRCASGTRPDGFPISRGIPLTYKIGTSSASPSSGLRLPEGETPVTVTVTTPAGATKTVTTQIRLDAVPPHNLAITGLPATDAIGEGTYELSGEATDGSGSTTSAGIASLGLAVDGVPLGGSAATCAPGPCTAHGHWTLNAAEIGSGAHTLTLTATDRAGNTATTSTTVTVHAATPVPVGPGTVNPVSGAFDLSAKDVSLAGNLEVTRSYDSREGTGGEPGILGPQWYLALAGEQSLTELPSGAITVTTASGGAVTFAPNGTGGYQAPAGDANLTLTHTATGYTLTDPGQTTTTFTHPAEPHFTIPGLFRTAGSPGAGAGALTQPDAVATNAAGAVFVTDTSTDSISEFSSAGAFVRTFGEPGSNPGQLREPEGVAVSPHGEVWVADSGNDRIQVYTETGQYLRQIGSPGSGAGQLSRPAGLAFDAHGNVWVADTGNERLSEFTEAGSLVREVGSSGTGPDQFREPNGVAVTPAGHIVVTDGINDRIAVYGANGEYLSTFGTPGKEPGQFERPNGIAATATGAILVSDTSFASHVVQAFSEGGEYLGRLGSPSGSVTEFSIPAGVATSTSGAIWVADPLGHHIAEYARPLFMASLAEGPGPSETVTYAYETVETNGHVLTRPTLALAPKGAGVTCGLAAQPELARGCRALTFNYASTTTATGEGKGEWGDYLGNLTRIYYTAWEPSAGAMQTREIVHYLYDHQGRLRAEWNPTITPAQQTTYAYGPEGLLSAISPPGLEPWLLHFGATSADPHGVGRLLGVTRPPASAALSSGPAPANTSAPTLSNQAPSVGATVHVASQGSWTGSPLAYTYQWEACEYREPPGEYACAPIPGATNASYTPQAREAGEYLAAIVTARNAEGAGTATTAYTVSPVAAAAPAYSSSFGSFGTALGEFHDPLGVAVDAKGDVWVADAWNARVDEFSATGSYIGSYSPITGALPEGVAVSPVSGDIFVTYDTTGDGVAELSPTGALIRTFAAHESEGALFSPSSVTVTAEGDVWVSNTDYDRLEEFSEDGAYLGKAGGAGSGEGELLNPIGIVDCDGKLYVADAGKDRLAVFSTKGQFEHAISPGEATLGSPTYIACQPEGDTIYVGDETHARVNIFNHAGDYLGSFGGAGSGEGEFERPEGVAALGNAIYVSDAGHNRVQEWTLPASPNPAPSPPSEGTNATTTIDYNVPVSGSGAPAALGATEVAQWDQTDDPVEGTAIFPADEPMGWPAQSYKKATIYYFDGHGRTVNTATPGGAIATSEYNATNDVVRTLSADNRATAIAAGSKSAEVAANLSTISEYNADGSEVLSTLGPEHEVQLTNGKRVQAREHTVYSYDEGAPEEGGPYRLVTKERQGAQIAGEPEQDVRTTITSYSGQEGLGWRLRRPTSTTIDPAGLDLTHSTIYDAETGGVIETRTPDANTETVSPPEPAFRFGTEGSGEGQMIKPTGVAIGPEGDAWVLDTNNDRLEKFTSTGAFVAAYGSKGHGAGQFETPWGIAVNQKTGNVYVADTGNNRIEEFTSQGQYQRQWGTSGAEEGHFEAPVGIAIDASGHVWVASFEDDHIQEFSEAGEAMKREFGAKGTAEGQFEGPTYMTFSEGMLYVVDQRNKRVEEFSTTSGGAVQYAGQFGAPGKERGEFEEPAGIATAPVTGDLYITDEKNHSVLEFSPHGKYLAQFGWWGNGENEFAGPVGIAANPAGSVYVADRYNNRISVWQQPEAGGARMTYSTQFGTAGSGEGQFEYPAVPAVDSHGNVWVTDNKADHVEEFTAQGKYLATYGSAGAGNDQFDGPSGIAVNQATDDVYVSDMYKHVIQELGPQGEFLREFTSEWLNLPGAIAIDASGDVWVTDMANDEIEEFSATGTFLHRYGSKGAGELQFNDPVGIVIVANTVYVADTKNNRIEELSTSGQYLGQFSREGANGGELDVPEGIAANSAGDLFVEDTGNDRIEEFGPTGRYLETLGTFGEGDGQLRSPQGIAMTPAGDIYVSDPGNHRVEKWVPDAQAVHDTKTTYFTAGANSQHPECGEHPEWALLPCRAEPAAQPDTEGLPALPTTTTSYNYYDEPTTTTEVSGSTTRTTLQSYDAAGRETAAVTDGPGVALPTVTNHYDEHTGLLSEQTSESEGVQTSLVWRYNTLGQLASYTDGSGSVTSDKYDIDGHVTEISDPKGVQTYHYDATTGQLTELIASGVGAFKAAYDPEGNLTEETYPNGMTATYTANAVAEPTSLTYTKTTNCSESCVWLTDKVVPTIHGAWAAQQSSLGTAAYAYDAAGRLTAVQETPSGEGCVTQQYAYDNETNRTSQTTLAPGANGECGAGAATVARHTYDAANRLLDEGVAYDAFGDMTSVPAADAGGSTLTSTFFADGQVATQTQAGETLTDTLDPEGRVQTVVGSGNEATDTINHYDAPGGSPAWTEEPASGKWSRNIAGIAGGLVAVQEGGAEATLELSDLQGNIIATAFLSPTATHLASTERSTPFGVPTTSHPKHYGWLGGDLLATERPSGVVTMGVRSYVATLGRFLQVDPVEGGSANQYAYTQGNPVTETDLSGEITGNLSEGEIASAEVASQRVIAEAIAREEAARLEAERKEREAAEAADGTMTITFHFHHGGRRARAAFWGIKKAEKLVEKAVSHVVKHAWNDLEHAATWVWDTVQSETFQKIGACLEGAQKISDALQLDNWKEFPDVVISVELLGCYGGVHEVDFGPGG